MGNKQRKGRGWTYPRLFRFTLVITYTLVVQAPVLDCCHYYYNW